MHENVEGFEDSAQEATDRRRVVERQVSKVGFAILVVILLVGLLRIAFNMGYYYSSFGCEGYLRPSCYISFLADKLVLVIAGLFLAVLSLWLPKTSRLFLLSLGVILSGFGYFLWYRGTLGILRVAEVDHFSQLANEPQHLIPLSGATWWDLLVLAATALFFMLQIRSLIILLKKPRDLSE